MQIDSASNLWPNLESLMKKAEAGLQNGQSFADSIPADMTAGTAAAASGGPSSGATVSGKFQYTMLEAVGDNSLFTPGDPNVPGAAKAAFANALENFMQLAQAGGQLSGPSTFQTSSTFVGNGGREVFAWSGEFSLQPDAAPASGPSTG